jgi:xylan 1,4-beta-xylosidase
VRLALLLCLALPLAAETITVDADARTGPWRSIWTYFGYDEPNYTYMANGRKLIGELAAASKGPVYIRAHNLLTTGDGTPALKWGSTNAYTEDAQGRAVYDWTIVDRIFDTYVQAGARPFVEIGFMPKALSAHPEPYQHQWPKTKIAAGWAYPPKDYAKWSELVYQWVRHSIDRYGKAEVASWYWEVWNEPDIEYWQGTPEEYNHLYDAAVEAVKRALPEARVGGPATTGPASPKAAAFLRQFLAHCAEGHPLDFISYHAKGRPEVAGGHVRMGLDKELDDVRKGLEVIAEFPQFRKLPIILSEADPEGCAACSARTHPPNAYRNGALYASYTAAALRAILDAGPTIEGLLTWAFEFEGQPYFDGFRTLATNGIDKPVLNVFRMTGLMGGERLALNASGVIDGLAARAERSVSILLWHYHADDVPGPAAPVALDLIHLPPRVLLTHYRIDDEHSNAYAAWLRMGSPQSPTAEQIRTLEAAGQLQLLESPKWISASAPLHFELPRQGISLVQLSW